MLLEKYNSNDAKKTKRLTEMQVLTKDLTFYNIK